MSARYDVLGVRIHAIDPPELLREVEGWIGARSQRYVCFTTVHSVMETLADSPLQRVFNEGLAVPDGMPLVWLGRLRGHAVRRVYGPDLKLAFCERAAEAGWPVFFLGGAEGVAERLAEALKRSCPRLRVAGARGRRLRLGPAMRPTPTTGP
jgi:N-acetylglucosaminyldiphosphoundecaprenol N-acetyl-beta-D-mannosaminyltransferase